MNFFRVAILCTLVLVVALLFYCVFELLPNQQAAYAQYNEAKLARDEAARKAETQSVDEAPQSPAQPQKSASEQAYEQTMQDQEYDVLAQSLKKQSEQNAAGGAELKTEDTLIGKVTEVAAADAGGYLILKLAADTYTLKGETRQVGEGTKLYVACSNGCYLEVTVSPTMDRANKEFLAYVTEGSFNVPAGLGVEPPTPQVGDGVFYWSEFHDIPQKPTF